MRELRDVSAYYPVTYFPVISLYTFSAFISAASLTIALSTGSMVTGSCSMRAWDSSALRLPNLLLTEHPGVLVLALLHGEPVVK
jgi:hypothetical protein